ncbi:hypothetical protein MTR_6g060870 [Medicago truncatula]|uniref:Uncharacterized protein n=1 Tax=Medicago truncatula TaxID=3880 RepID=G7KND6_MEDTR|nr:hypothetical protein MTR_6g060870 [Medicago truncatula]
MWEEVSSTILHNKSPYQLLFDQDPDFNGLKVFGPLCFASTISSHMTKLDASAKNMCFLGL